MAALRLQGRNKRRISHRDRARATKAAANRWIATVGTSEGEQEFMISKVEIRRIPALLEGRHGWAIFFVPTGKSSVL
jgi:hypothetical protein